MDRSDSAKLNESNGSSSSRRRHKRSSRSAGRSDDDAAIAPLSPPSRDTREIYALSRSLSRSNKSSEADYASEKTAQEISSPQRSSPGSKEGKKGSQPPAPTTSSLSGKGETISTPSPVGKERVSLSVRTQLEDLEQKKLSEVRSSSKTEVLRAPIRRGSSTVNDRDAKSSTNSPPGPSFVSPRTRTQLEALEEKKLIESSSSNRRTEIARAPVRGSSSLSDRDAKLATASPSGSFVVSPSMRTQLEELEQKKLEESLSSRTQIARAPLRQGSSSRSDRDAKLAAASPSGSARVSLSARAQLDDLEQKKLAANPSTANSSQVRRSRQGAMTELEREKQIAANGMGSSVSSQPRKLSVSELEREKKIAAAGMNASAFESPRASGQYSKSGKVLTDQSGRSIDLDAEFARLHGGGSQVRRPSEEAEDKRLAALPGAIAVYEGEYEGDEDHEPDYVNPDNFDAERAQAEADMAAGRMEEQSPFAQLQEAQTQSAHSVRSQDDQQGQNRLFPSVKKSTLCLPLGFIIIVIIGVAVGVTFAVRSGKGGDSPTVAVLPGTLAPTASPTTLAPTPNPTTGQPSGSPRPSQSPSDSPTRFPWVVQGTVEGASFGSSVNIANDLLVFSNSTAVLSYDLVNEEWSPIGQPVLGDIVRLSETKRIVVRDGASVKVYDLIGGVWSQFGPDVVDFPITPDSIAISGDGSTIAMSVVVASGSRYLTRVYIYDGDAWSQYGLDVSETKPFISPAGTALSFNGTLLGVGVGDAPDGGFGGTSVFTLPRNLQGEWMWESILPGLRVFGGGPSVVMSWDDPEIIVTGGGGVITVFDQKALILGDPFSTHDVDFFGTPLLAVARGATAVAYAWNRTLRAKKLEGDIWVDRGFAPEFQFAIDSISFSSDGRLAVGQPEAGVVEIFELPG